MKIRIGNDIKMRLLIKSGDDIQPNVLSALVFVINKTAKQKAMEDLQNTLKFIHRFPIGRDMIGPSQYDIKPNDKNVNIVGDLPYHVLPNECYIHPYSGFGIYPNWDKKYTPIIDNVDLASYNASVVFTQYRDVIEAMFPANSQLYTGMYSVVVVAKVYKEGYSKDNTATVTVDYDELFELVGEGEGGKTGPIIINAGISTSEYEIWADAECTIRPNGHCENLYILFNNTFQSTETKEYGNVNTGYLTMDTNGSLLCNYSVNDEDGFWCISDEDATKYADRVPAGTVLKLEGQDGQIVDLDDSYVFSFGDQIGG